MTIRCNVKIDDGDGSGDAATTDDDNCVGSHHKSLHNFSNTQVEVCLGLRTERTGEEEEEDVVLGGHEGLQGNLQAVQEQLQTETHHQQTKC